ncbi:Alpha-amylase inhibitor 5 [Dichanthelium oligosanthes]|uniref:Alpha-amylase inhibitor 5 n=1 Tax=Dichanthelium oligosanthes TaxID=888268 RepID=A0A1E5W1N4_9POAL|nr:Alpha-amylase inhibitor 5 [Dichanthelium oligosanthes]
MASVHLLLAAVLLSLLAACAATTDPTACAPGMAIPIPPVPSCRIYAVSRTCGLGGPYGPQDPSPVFKERCCRELAAVPPRCRCAALEYMMDSDFGRLQDFRGCTREAQRSLASRLTRAAECDLRTIDGGMSSYVLLSAAAVLLSILAAASASTNWCEPGLVIPLDPLPSCRAYLVRRTCGPGRGRFVPLRLIKERCCRELEDIVPYCRCGALRIMMDSMPGGSGVQTSPCSWAGQLDLAATLVTEAECSLPTIHGRPFCYALGAEGTTSD